MISARTEIQSQSSLSAEELQETIADLKQANIELDTETLIQLAIARREYHDISHVIDKFKKLKDYSDNNLKNERKLPGKSAEPLFTSYNCLIILEFINYPSVDTSFLLQNLHQHVSLLPLSNPICRRKFSDLMCHLSTHALIEYLIKLNQNEEFDFPPFLNVLKLHEKQHFVLDLILTSGNSDQYLKLDEKTFNIFFRIRTSLRAEFGDDFTISYFQRPDKYILFSDIIKMTEYLKQEQFDDRLFDYMLSSLHRDIRMNRLLSETFTDPSIVMDRIAHLIRHYKNILPLKTLLKEIPLLHMEGFNIHLFLQCDPKTLDTLTQKINDSHPTPFSKTQLPQTIKLFVKLLELEQIKLAKLTMLIGTLPSSKSSYASLFKQDNPLRSIDPFKIVFEFTKLREPQNRKVP